MNPLHPKNEDDMLWDYGKLASAIEI